jgi:Ca2+-binding RTX toxin-like protein
MRRLVSLLAFATAFGVAASASASTMSLDPTTGMATYRSGAVAGDVTLLEAFSPFRVQVWDLADPVQSGTGCVAGVPVTCEGPSGYDVGLGGGDDHFKGLSEVLAMTVTGGSGSDVITSAGLGNDVRAGGGDDTVGVNGQGQAFGNAGDDRLYAAEDVGALDGGAGDDVVVGETRSLTTLTGGPGNDALVARRGSGTIEGGPGNDAIAFKDAWTVTGGEGDDWIVQMGEGIGPSGNLENGASVVSGGSGSDHIDVVNGQADTVTCGGGLDVVYAEPADTVANNCESRRSGPMPPSPAIDGALSEAAGLPGTLFVFEPPAPPAT